MKRHTLLAILIASATSGCAIQSVDEGSGFGTYDEQAPSDPKASTIEQASFSNSKVSGDVLLPKNATVKPATRMFYKREIPSNTKFARKSATISSESISLLGMITELYPTINVIPMDDAVDLNKTYKVYANKLPFEEFLSNLENMTGYEIQYSNGSIKAYGNTTRNLNISALSGDKLGLIGLLDAVNSTLETESTNSFAALVDNETKLILSGPPVKVKQAEGIVEEIITDAMKQVLITVQMFNRNYGASEGLSQGRAIARNGRYAGINSNKLFKVPASYIDDSGKLYDVEMSMDIVVKPLIAKNNNIIIKLKPEFKSISNAAGTVILNPKEVSKINKRYSSLETEVITKSGQSIDVGSAMTAMLSSGVRFNSSEGKEVRNQIFWNKSSNTDLSEFNLTLTATTVESK